MTLRVKNQLNNMPLTLMLCCYIHINVSETARILEKKRTKNFFMNHTSKQLFKTKTNLTNFSIVYFATSWLNKTLFIVIIPYKLILDFFTKKKIISSKFKKIANESPKYGTDLNKYGCKSCFLLKMRRNI